jgi:alcohol dehydrogenase class IV
MTAGLAFELGAPTRIVFGAGCARQVGALAAGLGKCALVVTGKSPERAHVVLEALAAAGVRATTFSVAGEPSVETARSGVAAARAASCDVVLAFGGGSSLDAGKAIAALVANGGDPLDYLEVVGRGQPLTRRSLPFIAIPTTAGTGSEVTKNAVLASGEPGEGGNPGNGGNGGNAGIKASLRSPLMLPSVAVVDPELLVGLPAEVLASSGLDALSQLIEPFVSVRANPLTDGFAREGLRRSASALRRAYTAARTGAVVAPADREALALASLLGGLSLANAGLGAVHGFAAPVGGIFHAPHGAVCAALLGPVMQINVAALRARNPDGPALGRYQEVAALVTGTPGATIEDGLAWVAALCRALDVPGLARYGMRASDVAGVVSQARVASSMKGNPIALTDAELGEIATRALGTA